MSVELVCWSVLKPHDTDTGNTDSDSESESESEDDKALRTIEEEITSLQDDLESLEWNLQTANNSILAWEAYGRNLCGIRTEAGEDKPEEPVETVRMTKFIELYGTTRSDAQKIRSRVREKTREIETKTKELKKLREKVDKRITKHNDHLRQQQKSKENPFAVKYPYYRLKVTVEAETLPPDAPSIIAEIDTGKPKHSDDEAPPSDANGPSLRISYLVSHASWSPKFELRLDTVSRSGVLGFRAETSNVTAETWNEATVILSTVEDKYSGFFERIPQLNEWKIGLGKKEDGDKNMFSIQEREHHETQLKPPNPQSGNLFGTGTGFSLSCVGAASQSATATGGLFGRQQLQQFPAASGFGAAVATPPQPTPRSLFGGVTSTGGGLFGNSSKQPSLTMAFSAPATAPSAGGLFGSSSQQLSSTPAFGQSTSVFAQPTPVFGQSTSTSLFGTRQPAASSGAVPETQPDEHRRSPSLTSTSHASSVAPLPYKADSKMTLSTSTTNTYGITTIFSLPGKKTLPTSATPLRFMVSETTLSNIDLTYTCIPKFRAAAFLTASLSLPSSAPPLPEKSTASLSVDGTFLGTLPLPEKPGDGEKLVIPLGVDEGIEVTYAPPKHRSEVKGILRKEETLTFTRAFTIRNRKGRKVVVVVRDQVPVVDEEKPVRMTVKKPVEVEGEVEIKEGGKVEWRYELEAGEVRKGELEWEVVVESGEGVVNLS